jgi:hypothetical protein
VSDVITLGQTIELKITMDQRTGAVTVNGPIVNKLLCFGLLKIAEMQIAAFDPTKAIMPAAAMPAIRREQ